MNDAETVGAPWIIWTAVRPEISDSLEKVFVYSVSGCLAGKWRFQQGRVKPPWLVVQATVKGNNRQNVVYSGKRRASVGYKKDCETDR